MSKLSTTQERTQVYRSVVEAVSIDNSLAPRKSNYYDNDGNPVQSTLPDGLWRRLWEDLPVSKILYQDRKFVRFVTHAFDQIEYAKLNFKTLAYIAFVDGSQDIRNSALRGKDAKIRDLEGLIARSVTESERRVLASHNSASAYVAAMDGVSGRDPLTRRKNLEALERIGVIKVHHFGRPGEINKATQVEIVFPVCDFETKRRVEELRDEAESWYASVQPGVTAMYANQAKHAEINRQRKQELRQERLESVPDQLPSHVISALRNPETGRYTLFGPVEDAGDPQYVDLETIESQLILESGLTRTRDSYIMNPVLVTTNTGTQKYASQVHKLRLVGGLQSSRRNRAGCDP